MLAAERFEDPENARVILLSAAGLVLVAVLVAAGTFWWWRSSRVEHPALGPLEVMGSRSFSKGDYTSRRRRLEAARPAGAEPADASAAPVGEPVDLRAAAAGVPPQFDDLADVSVAADANGDGARPHTDLAALVAAVSSGAAAAAVSEPDELPAGDVVVRDDSSLGGLPAAGAEAEEAQQAVAVAAAPVEDEEEADPTSVSAEVPRPIDPLLRLQSE